MYIDEIYIRFFRSFNFDYLRQAHPNAQPDPWDLTPGGSFLPFVKISMEAGITTVVGANESGKSQLLAAMECALTGQDIKRSDFCRYSDQFVINTTMPLPEFGITLSGITPNEHQQIRESHIADLSPDATVVRVFRLNTGCIAYVHESGEWVRHQVAQPDLLHKALPHPFKIDSSIPLPNSVPIHYFALDAKKRKATLNRTSRLAVSHLVNENFIEDAEPPPAEQLGRSIIEAAKTRAASKEEKAQLRLAEQLLISVGEIDQSAFEELLDAVNRGDDGYANAIVAQMNRLLARGLNFSRWWSQDTQFELRLTLRDYDLVLTVRDRTGTDYSFSERSGGLKYFLSYFVQYLAHERPPGYSAEVLLMDEPDAFLSSQGQQDLLRIFARFADPVDERPPCQVVYVTHSPYLIDRNHGERVRVLEKGELDEGTRVVDNATQNHYEPLRSALGMSVGEMALIGNCNLVVEGVSDQVLLAGMTASLHRLDDVIPESEKIDLNTLTIVPAGSASHIPYVVYLARGRDVDRPAILALLDGDQSGKDALKELQRGGPKRKQLLAPEYILELGKLEAEDLKGVRTGPPRDIEDLFPLSILCEAALRNISWLFDGEADPRLSAIVAALESMEVTDEPGIVEQMESAASAAAEMRVNIDKLALAKTIIEVIGEPASEEANKVAQQNLRQLFREINRRQRLAVSALAQDKASAKIKRLVEQFVREHLQGATKDDAVALLDDVERAIVDTVLYDDLAVQLTGLRSKHALGMDLGSQVDNWDSFKSDVNSLVYFERNKADISVAP